MAVIKNVELWWVKCNPERPSRYQNKGPAKNGLEIRIYDKKQKDTLAKEYGFKFNTDETDDGKVFYKTSLNRYTYRSLPNGGGEDIKNPNKPINCVASDLTKLDPDIIGNGSIGNVSFSVKDDKSSRTLKGIQVTKLKKFERKDNDAFEMEEGFEVIDSDGNVGDSTDDIY